ncbi:hypothetical protein CLV60_13113 [Dyadobacter jiangsuensis]|uniref:Uncharacterized protein n=1 Tax=Dyadobacter jiangsuensis TaxID=1591085 RepID=A0A2P8F9K4_9BACT|nr:hypothetical protein CLV60_13113 [Dyadobacter jiangsuensis]
MANCSLLKKSHGAVAGKGALGIGNTSTTLSLLVQEQREVCVKLLLNGPKSYSMCVKCAQIKDFDK